MILRYLGKKRISPYHQLQAGVSFQDDTLNISGILSELLLKRRTTQ